MKSKKLYKHILKNLFHEQATEIVPFLFPEYQITRAMDIELATIKITPLERTHTDMEQGLTNLVLPGARITGVMQSEWIEHSVTKLGITFGPGEAGGATISTTICAPYQEHAR